MWRGGCRRGRGVSAGRSRDAGAHRVAASSALTSALNPAHPPPAAPAPAAAPARPRCPLRGQRARVERRGRCSTCAAASASSAPTRSPRRACSSAWHGCTHVGFAGRRKCTAGRSPLAATCARYQQRHHQSPPTGTPRQAAQPPGPSLLPSHRSIIVKMMSRLSIVSCGIAISMRPCSGRGRSRGEGAEVPAQTACQLLSCKRIRARPAAL